MLADVVAKLTGDRLQAALDLDPEGASKLAATQLDESDSWECRAQPDRLSPDPGGRRRSPEHRDEPLLYRALE